MLKILRNMLTIYDKGLIILIILVTLSGIGWSFLHFVNSDARYVVIEHNSQVVSKVRLVEGLEKKISLDLSSGKAEIVIKEGKVRILEMPKEVCPLGICSDTGWISRAGEMIVCMPNKIVVAIKSKGVSQEPDAVVY
ncbi:MAG: hypothetical protein AWU54_851 [Candidatus Frackibacter sp. T328-2]|nr:MAG: hypothetical protein AWU54_851 [Candidatus Frackibacter sp. T328-2]